MNNDKRNIVGKLELREGKALNCVEVIEKLDIIIEMLKSIGKDTKHTVSMNSPGAKGVIE